MSYARQTSNELFRQMDGIQDWLHLIKQAEQTEGAFGDIAVECFGKVFPVSESLCRNLAPSREAGQKVAPTVVQGPPYSRTGNERVECDAIVPVADPAYCLETTCNDYSRADGFNMIASPIALAENTIGRQPMNGGNGDGFTVGGPMYTLNATGVHGVAQPIPLNSMNCFRSPDADKSTGCGIGEQGEAMFTLTKTNHHAVAQPTVLMDQGGSVMNVLQDGTVGTLRRETHGHEPCIVHGVEQPIAFTTEQTPKFNEDQALTLTKSEAKHNQSVLTAMAVRRLTPTECERLQGFPDGYTDIQPNGKPTPDGPRYKALGNSMAVPVMKWIGEKLNEIDCDFF
jgi:hypothetical protein